MKPWRQEEAIAKPSAAHGGARELLLLCFMSTKKPMVAVAAKCRELWAGLLAGSSAAVVHSSAAADGGGDYFRWSYEFSCTTTPVVPVKGCGHRRLPPCVGSRQAKEMAATPFTVRSPEAGAGHEIDGKAEEFINRFYEQLRQQSPANTLM